MSDPASFERQKTQRAAQQKIEKVEKQITRLEKEIKEIDFDLEIEYNKTCLLYTSDAADE